MNFGPLSIPVEIIDAVIAIAVYVFADAVFTGLVALKVGVFELRTWSLYLEKLGSETVGFVVLAGAIGVLRGPAQVALMSVFAASAAIFTAAEVAGLIDKFKELVGTSSSAAPVQSNTVNAGTGQKLG